MDAIFTDHDAFAMNEPMPVGGRKQRAGATPEPDILGYEDGLVHEHNWACRERGAKAHG